MALSVKWLSVSFRGRNAVLRKIAVARAAHAEYTHVMQLRPLLFVAIACGIGFACGGGQPEPAAPTTTPSATASELPAPVASSAAAAASAAESGAPVASIAPSAVAPEKAWKDKTHDEKLAVMKEVVMPKMKAVFQEYDAKEFKDFSCVTCHGPDAKKGNFEMPNPKLPKLNFKDGFAKHKKKTPKMLTFMMEKVTPEMVTALKVDHFDPKTNSGFGCGGCHTFEK